MSDAGEGGPAEIEESTAGAETGQLVRSSAVVGIGTALSRVTGLVRVGALTYALGLGPLSDAYNLANNTPNIVYELILGGVLSATLVPVFVRHDDDDDPDATSAVVTVAVAALVALTVVAVIAAPLIIKAYTWRLSPDQAAAQEQVAVPLLRLFLPQMLFYGLTAIGTALLNARRRFVVPAFAPVLNNVAVSTVLIALPRVADRPLTLDSVRDDRVLLVLLGLGTTAGIAAMTVVLWPAVRAAGWRLRWNPAWRHPSVRAVGRLSGWTFGYVAANQVALFVILALANRGGGSLSAYAYAFVFFQLPHGLFSVSIMTTFVPDLAATASRADWGEFRARFSLGVRLMILVALPAAVGYGLLARPLVAALLNRGLFSGGDALLTADVLANFAVGLLGFSVYLFTLRAFYAMHDTRTPFFLNLAENAINVALGLALVGRYGVQGLAFAYSIAYTVAAVIALAALRRRVGGVEGRQMATSAAKLALGTAVMGAAVYGVTRAVGADSGTGAVTRVAAGVTVGAVVCGLAVFALRAEELAGLRDRTLRRRRAAPPGTPMP
ncbi:murein biosynthesis integral membrane protein MurJ [soil metagenome]